MGWRGRARLRIFRRTRFSAVEDLQLLFAYGGCGVASHVRLSYLRVEHPQFHLIVDKDGKTNQPEPKHPNTSNDPVTDTLLDLKAREVELADGVALLNDRAIPFDMAARDLEAEVHYICVDRPLWRDGGPERPADEDREAAGGAVDAASGGGAGRDMAELTKLSSRAGRARCCATASSRHFAKPEWQVKVKGSLELKQLSVLAEVDGLNAGTIDLDLNAHNCVTPATVAQKHPHFWQRSHPKETAKPPRPLPPDPDCMAGYLLVGTAKMHKLRTAMNMCGCTMLTGARRCI